VGVGVTVYSLSTMFENQIACEKMCDLTHGDEVKASGDPERQDILNTQKNQRVLAWGENCQSWAEKTVDKCRKQCKIR
jgi:hypothetical protein